MPRKGKLERQRERVRELLRADPSRSNRSIAAEVGCSHHTVGRTRELLPAVLPASDGPGSGPHPGSGNLIAPGPGNDRAVTHGAYSEARRRPLEDEHRERLRAEFPEARDDLINAAARRCAMIDLFSAWIAEHGPVRGRGDVVAAARELRMLLTDHERALAALDALRQPAPGAALAAELAKSRAAWERLEAEGVNDAVA
jgi:hypothetical protein